MGFCPYCGKQLLDGEICYCTTPQAENAQGGASGTPSNENSPTDYSNGGGYQQGGNARPGGFAPSRPNPFGAFFKRYFRLFRGDSTGALLDTMQDKSIAWTVVLGAFVLLGSLAGAVGVLGAIDGVPYLSYALSFGFGNLFGKLFGTILLFNTMMLGALWGSIILPCVILKRPIDIMGSLNMLAFAILPSVAVTPLVIMFSFFFVGGALFLGAATAIITTVFICVAVKLHTGKENSVWLPCIITGAQVLSYMILAYLLVYTGIM